MRAFRPSQFGRNDEVGEEVEMAKQAKVLYYSQRAQAGLPLFEMPPRTPVVKTSTHVRFAVRH